MSKKEKLMQIYKKYSPKSLRLWGILLNIFINIILFAIITLVKYNLQKNSNNTNQKKYYNNKFKRKG